MWCSTCAKSIRESVSGLEGIERADLNYTSKILVVSTTGPETSQQIDEAVRDKVTAIGFGIKRQPAGWYLNFQKNLQRETDQKIPWPQICVVWFLAMWSTMLAFAGYMGGDLTKMEHYYLTLASAAFGIPAIFLGLLPYARAGLRAAWFSRLPTLDLFIFIGGLSAAAISILNLIRGESVSYADSSSMIIAILLLTKKIENSVSANATSSLLYQINQKENLVEVYRKGSWGRAEASQIKEGSLVRFSEGETIAFDGTLETDVAAINNHLMSGEGQTVRLKKGDHIFAGAISEGALEMRVTASQGQRKMDAWAESALLSVSAKSKFEKRFSMVESSLVVLAFLGAFSMVLASFMRGGEKSAIIESFFVGILIFCPCLFASIIPLTKQLSRAALSKAGLWLQSDDALWDLAKASRFYLDKTGTLEFVESSFLPLEVSDRTTLPYLKSLASKSQHIVLRGLPAIDGHEVPLEEISETAGMGVVATAADGTEILVGRARFARQRGIAASGFDSLFTLVALNGKVVGQILRKSLYDRESHRFLEKLIRIRPHAQIEILSGDPKPSAGDEFLKTDSRISYFGNLSPEEKASRVGSDSVFVGDGLNDTLALVKARVSFRLGYRIHGFAPVDFQLKAPNLNLILLAVRYSEKYRLVIQQTVVAAFVYNLIALALAVSGKFSPLGAVVAMALSFSLMLLSVMRLRSVEGISI